jgi:hypothetical protein
VRVVIDRAVTALAWRALLAAARTPAVWAAMAVQIALFALYMLLWGDGLPIVDARSVLEQFSTLQWVFLGVALPWVAVRCGAAPGRDDVAQTAALAAVLPSAVVTAGIVAVAGLLFAVSLVGLPFAFLAQQIAAAPAGDLWRTQLSIHALSLCAAALASACMLVVANRLFAWTATTALTLGAMALTPAGPAGSAALLAIGVIVCAMTLVGADRRYWYLSEHV